MAVDYNRVVKLRVFLAWREVFNACMVRRLLNQLCICTES